MSPAAFHTFVLRLTVDDPVAAIAVDICRAEGRHPFAYNGQRHMYEWQSEVLTIMMRTAAAQLIADRINLGDQF